MKSSRKGLIDIKDEMQLLEFKHAAPFLYFHSITRSSFPSKDVKSFFPIGPRVRQFILVKCEPPIAVPCSYLNLNIQGVYKVYGLNVSVSNLIVGNMVIFN